MAIQVRLWSDVNNIGSVIQQHSGLFFSYTEDRQQLSALEIGQTHACLSLRHAKDMCVKNWNHYIVRRPDRFIVQLWKSPSACLSHNSSIALLNKSLSKMLISHVALYQPRCPYLIFWTLAHYRSLSHNDFHIKKALDPTMIKRI